MSGASETARARTAIGSQRGHRSTTAGFGCRVDGLKDELGRGLWLGHERYVRGRHLHDRGVRALGHEPLQRWRDGLVLGTEQIPARQRLPRRRARRRTPVARSQGKRTSLLPVAVRSSGQSGVTLVQAPTPMLFPELGRPWPVPGEQLWEVRLEHAELGAPRVTHDPEVKAALLLVVIAGRAERLPRRTSASTSSASTSSVSKSRCIRSLEPSRRRSRWSSTRISASGNRSSRGGPDEQCATRRWLVRMGLLGPQRW
jgi:hypothetical protein